MWGYGCLTRRADICIITGSDSYNNWLPLKKTSRIGWRIPMHDPEGGHLYNNWL